jgi:hypothetical protein
MIVNQSGRIARVLCVLFAPFLAAGAAWAAPVTLGSPSATYCQASYLVTAAIDGNYDNGNGWAVDGRTPGSGPVAVFQSATDLGAAAGTQLRIQFHHRFIDRHSLGKFRLSATTSDRSTYAQGGACNNANAEGTAVWTVLTPGYLDSAGGETLTVQQDGTILASGTLPTTDVVTFEVSTPLHGITGFRLETFADASLPVNGPGRYPTNGNFVLTEFTVDAEGLNVVPTLDARALALMALLLAAGGFVALRRRSS